MMRQRVSVRIVINFQQYRCGFCDETKHIRTFEYEIIDFDMRTYFMEL